MKFKTALRVALLITLSGVCSAQNWPESEMRRGQELQADWEKARQHMSEVAFEFLANQVVEAERDVKRLKARYTSSHPEVRKAEERLASASKRLEQARQSSAKPDPQSLTQRTLGDSGWWQHPGIAQYLGITADQRQRMDNVFRQYRLKLVDLNATLEKEELTLEPLVAADVVDESEIIAKLDRVAQARAEVEKAAGRMLLGIRKVLTTDQWRKRTQMQSDTARTR